MKKSFFVVPALLVAGIFVASCSFNSVSPDMSFRVDLPRSTAKDDGSPDYNYAVYVTGRTEPWRGVVSQKNNVITLDEFPLGSGTVYAGFLRIDFGSDGASNYPLSYSGQTNVDISEPESSMSLNVKKLDSNGVFDLPGVETQELAGQTQCSITKIEISNLPKDVLSDKGELYMCSFTYQTEDNANGPTYGPEIYAECPVWLVSNNSQCSIILNNYTGQTITNVKLRRWADRNWHECAVKDNSNSVSTSPDWKFTW